MSFEATLQTIVDECGGGYGAVLIGLDGIAVAQVGARSGPDREDPLQGDVTAAGIEFGRILVDMAKAADALGAGDLRETVVRLDRVTLVFHALEDDLFLVLALAPDGNLGKARYLMRRSVVAIRADL
jgi:predicted regulator of Ras-like GTPase activity (Roadblock/LC7/MglB family)